MKLSNGQSRYSKEVELLVEAATALTITIDALREAVELSPVSPEINDTLLSISRRQHALAEAIDSLSDDLYHAYE